MFINSIKLENYRIYYGKNELKFNKSDRKNIFIIAGNNGYGKTTLLTSLVWCLYGKGMSDVDEVFKTQVSEAGGYNRFAATNLNKVASTSSEYQYSVEINFSDISIPTIPCYSISIKRTYDIDSSGESVRILIDGNPNELTKEVGPEIFINDFILPKELAKFFFFDAEKIVNLAEIRSIEDKRRLSKAYSEIIGIKKYEDLRSSLEGLRIRFRRNSASESEIVRFKTLSERERMLTDNIDFNKKTISELKEEQQLKKKLSEELQERLIREGSVLSREEYIELVREQKELERSEAIFKAKLREVLELAPFAIASNLFQEMIQQAKNEQRLREQKESSDYISQKLADLKNDLPGILGDDIVSEPVPEYVSDRIIDRLKNIFLSQYDGSLASVNVIHDFSDTQLHDLLSISNNLRNSYTQFFQHLVRDYRLNKQRLVSITKKIRDAESRDQDLLVQKIKSQKKSLDDRILELERSIANHESETDNLVIERQTVNRMGSELSKKISLGELDREKDQVAERLIQKLDKFIVELKKEKKGSLEQGILRELSNLMHKQNFVSEVRVVITDELIEIELYDSNEQRIFLDTLSKGEQQLYATALLKALVDESNVRFPVFIDSPLQKFDQLHSRNIILEFYPNISEQVVLFPLLNKELTEEEYGSLKSFVNSCYFISNYSEHRSGFEQVENEKLFSEYVKRSNRVLWN